MFLAPGVCLGPYEIRNRIGEGGMGVVYRARDTRLNRDVAIKVLPQGFAEDRDRLRRFQTEAHAVGSLNHPNILAVFDTGTFEGAPYLVMELLEGETLRERLGGKPLPAKRAVEITLQIANGLSAAHEQGIVHRDLKPENIFLTKDGRVKILDFGLAKATAPLSQSGGGPATELHSSPLSGQGLPATAVGTMVGTVGYMSPEQVGGKTVDGRSDLFCLGVVLWEMLTGRHPFRGPSTVETLHAIVKEEPPELGPELKISPLLERVLRSCLAKEPAGRFHSAHDLAFALEAATFEGSSSTRIRVQPMPRKGRRAAVWAGAGAALALILTAGGVYLAWPALTRKPPPPSFTRLTFAPGLVDRAFFSADGRSVFFTGRFQGRPPEIYVRSPESPEPRLLESHGATLVGLSRTNDLAVLRDPRPSSAEGFHGTLAQLPAGGGAFRDLQEDVHEAAWSAGGRNLTILTMDEGFNRRLESPPGKVLYSTLGNLKLLTMEPNGNRMALVDGFGQTTNVTLFGGGAPVTLMSKSDDSYGASLTGLVWHPGGRELWVSEQQGNQTIFWAVTLAGKRRMVWRGPGAIRLLDLASDGRALVTVQQARRGVFLQRQGSAAAQDLSILDGTQAVAFMPDGLSLLLRESPANDGGTAQDLAFLRRVDGGPGLRLAAGNPRSLSSDGKFAGLAPTGPGAEDSEAMVFTPTGTGRTFGVDLPDTFVGADDWLLFHQGQKILFAGMEKGKNWQFYTMDRQGGTPKAFTPVGIRAPKPLLLSPDESSMIANTSAHGSYLRFPLDGGSPRPIKGLSDGERPVGWTRDGRGLFVTGRPSALPVQVFRLDPDSGARQLVTTFMPPDPAGYLATLDVCVAPDGNSFAFTYERRLGDLYLIEGLR